MVEVESLPVYALSPVFCVVGPNLNAPQLFGTSIVRTCDPFKSDKLDLFVVEGD